MKELLKYLHDYGTSSLDFYIEIANEQWQPDFNDDKFNAHWAIKNKMTEMSARLKNALKEFANEHEEEIKNAGD